jgi:hypothetical protein
MIDGRTYQEGPWGSNQGTVLSNGRIEGFFGGSGDYLDEIGIYVNPN